MPAIGREVGEPTAPAIPCDKGSVRVDLKMRDSTELLLQRQQYVAMRENENLHAPAPQLTHDVTAIVGVVTDVGPQPRIEIVNARGHARTG